MSAQVRYGVTNNGVLLYSSYGGGPWRLYSLYMVTNTIALPYRPRKTFPTAHNAFMFMPRELGA